MAWHLDNSCYHDRYDPEAPVEGWMHAVKKEEPYWQILLEVTQWSEPAPVNLDISDVEMTAEVESCINFIKMLLTGPLITLLSL